MNSYERRKALIQDVKDYHGSRWTAEQLGRLEFLNGTAQQANPFPVGHKMSDDWTKGWLAEQKVAQS